MSKPLTAVLGCGPSGLLAAHTLESYGCPVVIFSRKQKSVLGGAQFSHIGVPGLTDPEATLTYVVRGDAATYQKKVYGSSEVPFVSFDNVKDGMQVEAWNLRKMYDVLCDRYMNKVVDVPVLTGGRVEQFADAFDVVFSSVPASSLCTDHNNHWFRQQTIRIFNDILGGHNWLDAVEMSDNTIVYDGTDDVTWYRQSRIFGVGSTEWGAAANLPPVDLKTVNKPVATNCDCHPDVVRIGRFGTWQKGVLTFQAYDRVREVLTSDWGVEL